MASSASGAAGLFNPKPYPKAPLKKTYRWQSKHGGRVGFGRKPESTVQHIEKLQRRRVRGSPSCIAFLSPCNEVDLVLVHTVGRTRSGGCGDPETGEKLAAGVWTGRSHGVDKIPLRPLAVLNAAT